MSNALDDTIKIFTYDINWFPYPLVNIER